MTKGFKKPQPPPHWKPNQSEQHAAVIQLEAEYQHEHYMLETPLQIIMTGIASMVDRGAAIVREEVVLFWCMYRHRYGPYDDELNENLLQTMREFNALSVPDLPESTEEEKLA